MPYADPGRQRQFNREWIARRRAAWLADKCCAWCGSRQDLELDHVDPTVKVTHNVWSWTQARREVELAKCQVLCQRCHLVKTRDDRPEVLHGTANMYHTYRCRCRECKDWMAADKRDYRARKRAQQDVAQ